jgi:AraC-like DNA-binding protein
MSCDHATVGAMSESPTVPDVLNGPADRAEFRRSPHRAGVELYRAHIVQHAFEPHSHAAYGLGAIEAGAERFRYRGSEHVAPAASLVLMNPDELHTGRAETAGGWRYRMLYLDPSVLEAVTGEPGWWFDNAVAADAEAAGAASLLLARLWRDAAEPCATLAFDSSLAELLALLRRHTRSNLHPVPERSEADTRLDRAIDLMRARLGEPLTLAELAAAAQLSPFHFLRRFKSRHHATPQQMLMALRLLDAKRRLARGERPADVAAAVGLADQAHLNRAFVRRYGVTPGRYRRQVAPAAALRAG